MSRCCPRTPQKIIIQCGETPTVETNTFSNANVTGVGVFISEVDNAVTFKGIASSDGTITVSNDAPNNTVNLVINAAAIPALVPAATETVQGKIELATAAEVITGTDTTRAVTAAGLAGLTSTLLRRGLVELATNSETQVGTDTERAVTPASLKSLIDILGVQKYFSDDAARLTEAPGFIGQLGVQQDTQQMYIGDDTVAGAWRQSPLQAGQTTSIYATTTWDTDPANIVIQDLGATGNGLLMEQGGTLTIGSSGNLNFLNTGRTKIEGVSLLANHLIGTTSTAGQVDQRPINLFLSGYNPSPGYDPSNYVLTRAFDADTVTLPELADIVATLIIDMNSRLAPTLT